MVASLLFGLTAGDLVLPVQAKSDMHVIAHRGGRKWAPENTISAFRKSLAAGVYGIELDIHRCKTGELVVIHDEELGRTTDGDGYVADKTWDELKKLSAGKWYGAEFADERLPLLSEVLSLIDGKAELNIEIKNGFVSYPGIEYDLIKLLETYPHPDKIVISSFDHQCLLNIHQRTNKFRLAMLVDAILVDLPSYSQKLGTKNWHPGFADIGPAAVKQAHEAGLQANAWTVNGANEWAKAAQMKLDGVITDDPVGAMKFYQN